MIQFSQPVGDPTLLSSYKTLTVVNYTGIIGLNARLDTDGSPSDRLVINGGAASGNLLVQIANTGGGGAVTTGNGILLVDAINGGTTVPGRFALAGEVAAGPYEYGLYRSSVDGSNDPKRSDLSGSAPAATRTSARLPARDLVLRGAPLVCPALRPQPARHAA